MGAARNTQTCPDLPIIGSGEFVWSGRNMATSKIIQNERLNEA